MATDSYTVTPGPVDPLVLFGSRGSTEPGTACFAAFVALFGLVCVVLFYLYWRSYQKQKALEEEQREQSAYSHRSRMTTGSSSSSRATEGDFHGSSKNLPATAAATADHLEPLLEPADTKFDNNNSLAIGALTSGDFNKTQSDAFSRTAYGNDATTIT